MVLVSHEVLTLQKTFQLNLEVSIWHNVSCAHNHVANPSAQLCRALKSSNHQKSIKLSS